MRISLSEIRSSTFILRVTQELKLRFEESEIRSLKLILRVTQHKKCQKQTKIWAKNNIKILTIVNSITSSNLHQYQYL